MTTRNPDGSITIQEISDHGRYGSGIIIIGPLPPTTDEEDEQKI